MTKSSGQDAPKGNVGKRDITRPIRLTSDEAEKIDLAVEAMGTTFSSFVRGAVLTQARRVLRSLRDK